MIVDLKKGFIFLFFFVSPFVDSLTGVAIFQGILSEGSLFSPSQVFRLFLTILGLYLLRFSQFIAVVFAMILLISLELTSLYFHQNISGFFIGAVYAYKLIFIFLVFLVLYSAFSRQDSLTLLKYFVQGSAIYASLLIIAIVLGVDKSTYATGTFGSKGFFASGNGLSLFLGVSSLLALLYHISQRRMLTLFLYLILLIGTGLVGTKGSIFFVFVNFIFLLFLNKASFTTFSAIVVLSLLFLWERIVDIFSVVFDVIIFRYNNSPSIIAFLASNRDNYVKGAFEIFGSSEFVAFRSLFGSGIYLSFRDYRNLQLPLDTLESDFFDLFFSYGIIGISLYLIIIALGMYVSIRKSQYLLFTTWTSLCAYSLIGGHMLFNSMSNIAFLVLILLILKMPNAVYEKQTGYISST